LTPNHVDRKLAAIRVRPTDESIPRFILLLATILAGAILLSCAGRARHANILLITIDTTRADRIGAYGDHRALTPAIDRLALDGVEFCRATSQVPLTLPSHCSMMTGTYPSYHGVRKNGGFALDPYFDTMAEILRDAGYRTGAFLSAFSLNHIYGLTQGFDVYDDVAAGKEFLTKGDVLGTPQMRFPERPAAQTVDSALAWLGGAGNRPVFLWVHLFDPHDPYEPPAPYTKVFADDPYRGEIAAMDREIERLLEAFAARGEQIVVLLADHGESLGDHGESTHGYLLYEPTLHIPLVMGGAARLGRGVIRADIAETIDLLPTLLALLGVEWSAPLQGRDLMAAGAPAESIGYAESLFGKLSYDWSDLRMVRSGDLKYLHGPSPEIYDLSVDPGEGKSLFGESRSDADRLLGQLREILAMKPDLPETAGQVEIGKEEAEALAALGYIGSANLTGKRVGLDEVYGAGIDPKAGLPCIGLAHKMGAMLSRGQIDSAVTVAQEAGADPNAGTSLRLSIIAYLVKWGRSAVARTLAERLVLDEPASGDARVNLAASCIELGDLPAAREALVGALSLNPASPMAHFNLGRLHFIEGDRDSAIASLRESVRLDPSQVPVLMLLTRILREKGHAEEAYATVREAVRRQPENAEARAIKNELEQEYPELLEIPVPARKG